MTTTEAIAIVRGGLKASADQTSSVRGWIPPRIAEAMQHLADCAARELLKPRNIRPRRGRGGR